VTFGPPCPSGVATAVTVPPSVKPSNSAQFSCG
jgi:hypothetical protein